MLLEALRGSTSAMASGGAFARVSEASIVLAVLAPLPTLLFATPFFWWAGRLWGPKAAATLGGGHLKAENWAQRSGAHLERFGGIAVGLAGAAASPSSSGDALRASGVEYEQLMHDIDGLPVLA